MNCFKYVILLSFSALVSADTLGKVDKIDNGTYPQWKGLALKSKDIVKKKYESLVEATKKFGEAESLTLDYEVSRILELKNEVDAEADKIIALEESDYKNADTDEKKTEVAATAYRASITLYERVAEFETDVKKAELVNAKTLANTKGGIAIYKFFKRKLDVLGSDSFALAALVVAIVVPAAVSTTGSLLV